MQLETIILSILDIIILLVFSIIGYFLRKTMDELKEVRTKSDKNELNLAVLKNDHDTKHEHMVEKVASLTYSIDKLITKIDKLTDKLSD